MITIKENRITRITITLTFSVLVWIIEVSIISVSYLFNTRIVHVLFNLKKIGRIMPFCSYQVQHICDRYKYLLATRKLHFPGIKSFNGSHNCETFTPLRQQAIRLSVLVITTD